MIESVEFRNFRILRHTTLPLSRLTLIIGPNGSGKSTAIQALQAVVRPDNLDFRRVVTVDLRPTDEARVEVVVHWGESHQGDKIMMWWTPGGRLNMGLEDPHTQFLHAQLERIRFFALDASAIARPTQLAPNMELQTRSFPYTRHSLKRDVYDTDRPSLELETQRAIEAAQLLAQNLPLLERLFPHGFGSLAHAVRGWVLT